jgi:hypothetical protein
LEKFLEYFSSVVERDAWRKIVLLRWSAGAVGAGSVVTLTFNGNLY